MRKLLLIAFTAMPLVVGAVPLPSGPYPPIHTAADQGDAEFVAKWIRDGNNVDEEFNDTSFTLRTGKNQVRKVTPLMFAAQRGNLAIVKMLVEAGADVDKQSTYAVAAVGAYSVFDYAVDGGNPQVVDYVWSNPKRKNAPLNIDRNFASAFNGACGKEDTESWIDISKFLLKTFDAARATRALRPVTSEKCAGLVRVLNESGIKPDSWVMLASADRGDTNLVRLYLSKGAPVNDVQAVTGRTPLMLATMKSHMETMTALLDGGAKVDAQDAKGMTALMIAAQIPANGRECPGRDAMKLLLDRGAHSDLADEKGLKAMDFVDAAGKNDCTAKEAELLKKQAR